MKVFRTIKALCLLLMICSVVALFLPFFETGQENVSVIAYVLQPYNHKSVTTELQSVTGQKKLQTQAVLPLFAILFVNTFGTIVSILLPKTHACGIFCLLGGGITVYTMLAGIISGSGNNNRWLLLALGVLTLITGGVHEILAAKKHQ